MRRICSLIRGVVFLDATQNDSVKLGVKLCILLKIGFDRKPNGFCKICGKPIRHITVGTTRIRGYQLERKKHQVLNSIHQIRGKIGKIGAAIGSGVEIITVGTSQLLVGIPKELIAMRKVTIRSTFVK